MVVFSVALAGILGTAFSFLIQAVTSVVSLIVSIARAYMSYFTFIITLTRRDS